MPRQKTKDKKTGEAGKTSFFRDERLKIILGVLLIFLSLFMLLAFISYFFTWREDQSFAEFQKVFTGPDIKVENWTGKAGAWLTYTIFDKYGFGIASFGLPFLLFISGLRLFKIRMFPLRKTFRIVIFSMIILSITLGYAEGGTTLFFSNGIGGAQGTVVSKFLDALIGRPGTGLLILFLIFVFISFTIKPFISWFNRLILNLFSRKPKTEIIGETKADESNLDQNDDTAAVDFDTISAKEDLTKEVSENGVELLFEKPKVGEDIEKIVPELITQENDVVLDIEETVPEEETNAEAILREFGPYDPKLDLSNYKVPIVDLLEDHKSGNPEVTNEELISNKNKIVETLANYKIQIDKIKATIGPTVTLYEIVPAPGIRISKIKSLEDDIALSLAALGIRIIAPIPGRGTIGIEVPNRNPEVVSMKSVIVAKKFQESTFDLAIVLGKTISNETYVVDLTKMPHLLVAGATGQGKSVGLNAIIVSLLYKKHPSELKFVLIDPKKVELTLYSKIEKHFLAKLPDTEDPIITDTQKVIKTLNSLTIEMDNRYDLLKKAHVRNIKEYNSKFIERRLNPEHGHRFMPYIVLIIDEFADLIMTAGREIETPLARLAQLARAIGIHLIIATQRPTTNIITGVIKANFPVRIAFRVTSMIDSRTILDTNGANQLVGRGDMLISTGNDLIRLQCAFIDIAEIDKITNFISTQATYASALYLPEVPSDGIDEFSDVDLNKRDELFDEAAKLIVIHQQGSTSLIQRKFSIGYNRAGRIMDQLEAAGIVGPNEGSKARQVLIVDEMSLEQILNKLN
jgi:DNA segregation ATPase FtsK/SpoIIIE, S-DNA-T family